MKKYFKILPALCFVAVLSSCLKDKAIIGDQKSNIIEFYTTEPIKSPVTALYPVYIKSYVVGQDYSFDVTVSYSGSDVAPQDINVDVAVDPDALARFNTKATADGNTTYLPLNPANYNIPSTKAVIKKGERRAVIKVNVKLPADIDYNANYALPLTIKTASFGTISGNFGSVLYKVGPKNIYDGIYADKGFILRTPDPDGLGGNFSGISVPLSTLTGDKLSFVPTWNDGSTVGGIANVVITVDKVTNKVTMSSDNTALKNREGYDNRYDPATKTFYLSFYWAGNRGHIDTLVYTAPRP